MTLDYAPGGEAARARRGRAASPLGGPPVAQRIVMLDARERTGALAARSADAARAVGAARRLRVGSHARLLVAPGRDRGVGRADGPDRAALRLRRTARHRSGRSPRRARAQQPVPDGGQLLRGAARPPHGQRRPTSPRICGRSGCSRSSSPRTAGSSRRRPSTAAIVWDLRHGRDRRTVRAAGRRRPGDRAGRRRGRRRVGRRRRRGRLGRGRRSTARAPLRVGA